MHYRPDIDGLRAIAVVPVVLFHAGFTGWSGGFVGVDVFFVISGFLISSVILADHSEDRFSLARFWERRARRILPALATVVLATAALSWIFLTPSQLHDFGQSVSAVATFSSNIHFRLEAGYFDTVAELKPLLHTWSLAVEEQFYIVFPLILLGLLRLPRAALWAGISGLTLVSLLGAQMSLGDDPDAAFFLLPARMWELFSGVLLAIAMRAPVWRPLSHLWAELGSGLGLAMIVAAVVLFDSATPFPGLTALSPHLGHSVVHCLLPRGALDLPADGVATSGAGGSDVLWILPLAPAALCISAACPTGR